MAQLLGSPFEQAVAEMQATTSPLGNNIVQTQTPNPELNISGNYNENPQYEAPNVDATGFSGYVNQFAEGIGQVAGGVPKALAIANDYIKGSTPEENELYQWGQDVEDYFTSTNTDPEIRESLSGQITQGMGQLVGFIAGAGALTAAGGGIVGGAAASGLLGAGVSSTALFEDARKSGASLGDSFSAAGQGALLGLTEALPIARAFGRVIGPGKVKGFSDVIKGAAKQFGEEAIQEGFQTFGENIVAAKSVGYDPDRALMEGIFNAAGVGGATGFIAGLVLNTMGLKLRNRDGSMVMETEDGFEINPETDMGRAYLEAQKKKEALAGTSAHDHVTNPLASERASTFNQPIEDIYYQNTDIAKAALAFKKYPRVGEETIAATIKKDHANKLINDYVLNDNAKPEDRQEALDAIQEGGYQQELIDAQRQKEEEAKAELETEKAKQEEKDDKGKTKPTTPADKVKLQKLQKKYDDLAAKGQEYGATMGVKDLLAGPEDLIKERKQAKKEAAAEIAKAKRLTAKQKREATKKMDADRELIISAEQEKLNKIKAAVAAQQGPVVEIGGETFTPDVQAKQEFTDETPVTTEQLEAAGIPHIANSEYTFGELEEEDQQKLRDMYGPDMGAMKRAERSVAQAEHTELLVSAEDAGVDPQTLKLFRESGNAAQLKKKYKIKELKDLAKKFGLSLSENGKTLNIDPLSQKIANFVQTTQESTLGETIANNKKKKSKGGRKGVDFTGIQAEAPFTPVLASGDNVVASRLFYKGAQVDATGRVKYTEDNKVLVELGDGTWVTPAEVNSEKTLRPTNSALINQAPRVDTGGITITEETQAEKALAKEKENKFLAEEAAKADRAAKEDKKRREQAPRPPKVSIYTKAELDDIVQKMMEAGENKQRGIRDDSESGSYVQDLNTQHGADNSYTDWLKIALDYGQNNVIPKDTQETVPPVDEPTVDEPTVTVPEPTVDEPTVTVAEPKVAPAKKKATPAPKVNVKNDADFLAAFPATTLIDGEIGPTIEEIDGVTTVWDKEKGDYVSIRGMKDADRKKLLKQYEKKKATKKVAKKDEAVFEDEPEVDEYGAEDLGLDTTGRFGESDDWGFGGSNLSPATRTPTKLGIASLVAKARRLVDRINNNVEDLDVVLPTKRSDLDAYPNIRDQLFEADGTPTQYFNGMTGGLFENWPGTNGKSVVVINVSKYDNINTLRQIIFHETVGHFGIRKILGDQWSRFIDKAVTTNKLAASEAYRLIPDWSDYYLETVTDKDGKEVRQIIKEMMPKGVTNRIVDLPDGHKDGVVVNVGGAPRTVNKYLMRIMMDEYIAVEAELFYTKWQQGTAMEKPTGLLKRALAYIRHALRSFLGGETAATVTDSDISGLLAESYHRLVIGNSAVPRVAKQIIRRTGSKKGAADSLEKKIQLTQPWFSASPANRRRLTTRILEALPKKDTLSRGVIEGTANRQGFKAIDKQIITEVLETHFPEQKKISRADFISAVEDELMPLNLRLSGQYNDYGLDNINRQEVEDWARWSPQEEAVNSTRNFKPETHIWRGEFETPDNINHFNDDHYVGHTRTFIDNLTYYVSEVQSDLVQKNPFVNISEGDRQAARDDYNAADGIDRELAEMNTVRTLNYDAAKREQEKELGRELTQEETKELVANTLEAQAKKDWTGLKNKLRAIITSNASDAKLNIYAKIYNAMAEMDATATVLAQTLGNQDYGQSAMYKLSNLYLTVSDIRMNAYSKLQGQQEPHQYNQVKKHIYERMVREEVKRAANLGMASVRFPTGETAAQIEGWPDSIAPNQEIFISDLKKVERMFVYYPPEGRVIPVTFTGEVKVDSNSTVTLGALPKEVMHTSRNNEVIFIDLTAVHIDVSLLVQKQLKSTIKPEYQGLYNLYEKNLRKFLVKEYNAKEVTDEYGHTWMEIESLRGESQKATVVFSPAQRDRVNEQTLDAALKNKEELAAAVNERTEHIAALTDEMSNRQSQNNLIDKWRKTADELKAKHFDNTKYANAFDMFKGIAGGKRADVLIRNMLGETERTMRIAARVNKLVFTRKLTDTQDQLIRTAWLDGSITNGTFNPTWLTKHQIQLLTDLNNRLIEIQETIVNGGILNLPDGLRSKIIASKGQWLHTEFLHTLKSGSGSGFLTSGMDWLKKQKVPQHLKGQRGEVRNAKYGIIYSTNMLARDVALLEMYRNIQEQSDALGYNWVVTQRKEFPVNMEGKIQKMNLTQIAVTLEQKKDLLNNAPELLHQTADEIKRIHEDIKGLEDALEQHKNDDLEGIKEAMIRNGAPYARLDASGNVIPGTEVDLNNEKGDTLALKYRADNYILMDARKYPGMGALTGKYLDKRWFDVLVSDAQPIHDLGSNFVDKMLGLHRGSYLDQGNSWWKALKTVYNPTYWPRAFFGTAVQADLASDTNSATLTKYLITELNDMFLRKDTENVVRYAGKTLGDWAIQKGAFSTNFSTAELYAIRDDLSKTKAKGEFQKMIKEGKYGALPSLMFNIATDSMYTLGERLSRGNANMEGIFKTMLMRDYIESHMKALGIKSHAELNKRFNADQMNALMENAAAYAGKGVFEYHDIPNWLKTLRRIPLGTPFLTWSYKMFGSLGRATVKRPWKVAKYYLLGYAITQAILAGSDMDEEEYERALKDLPWHIKNKSSVMVIPYKNEKGQIHYLDWSWMFPPSFIIDGFLKVGNPGLGESHLSAAGETFFGTTGLFNGPIPQALAAILTHKDPFTQKDLWVQGDSDTANIGRYAQFFWNMATIPFLSESGFVGDVLKANELDEYGQDKNPFWTTDFPTLTGVNVKTYEPAKQRIRNMKRYEYLQSTIKAARAKAIKDMNMSREAKIKAITDAAQQLKQLQKKYIERN